MSAYREPDPVKLADFAKHLEIALTLLGLNQSLGHRLLGGSPDLVQSYRESWSDLWENLTQARAIAVSLQRDIGHFDEHQARAGNPHHVAGGLTPIRGEMRVATRAAIDCLRAAVPEVVVPDPAVETEPRPSPGLPVSVRWRIGVFVFTMIAAAMISYCAAH